MRIAPPLTRFLALSLMAMSCACDAAPSLPGAIYFETSDPGINRLDLSTGRVTTVLARSSDAYTGSAWDISWDGRMGVTYDEPSAFHADEGVRYIVFDTSTGVAIREVIYHPNSGETDGGFPNWSPNGKLLALRATFDDGLVILDMGGNILRDIHGEAGYLDPITWESGGSILYAKDGWLRRISADFRRSDSVRQLPTKKWSGYIAASPDGRKIALPVGNHIWMMNADGSDYHAITTSDRAEKTPVFSPDGKWLAIGCNPGAAGVVWESAGDTYAVSGTTFHLCIIPADGQVYDVSPGADSRVIHPQPRGESTTSGVGMTAGTFVWRP
ncbi:MAG: hypothetical protein LBE59_11290 [Nevskiaceae bacterium]|nr:hypothetical protein [Nevskiaceae bacterium]